MAHGRKVTVDLGVQRPPIVVRHTPPVVVPPPRLSAECKIITVHKYRGRTLILCKTTDGKIKPGMKGYVMKGRRGSRQRVPGGKVKVTKVRGTHALLRTSLTKKALGSARWVLFQ